MIVGNGRVFAQDPEGGWQDIGRATGIRRVDERVPLPAPVQIMEGLGGPESLAWMNETVRTQVVVAVDPAVPDPAVVFARYERRAADVRIEGRLEPQLGTRPPTGKQDALNVERPDGRMDIAILSRKYRTRAAHARARARRTELQRRDRRRARAGRPPLGPYAAVTVSIYLPQARIEIRPSLSDVVTATIRAATASMNAIGVGLAQAAAAMSQIRIPNPAMDPIAADAWAAWQRQQRQFDAFSFAGLMRDALARRGTCDCRLCRARRPGETDLDDELRSVPWTAEQIRRPDPPETHHDRLVADEETGAARLDSSGRGGSWTDFLARIDDLVDGDTSA